MPNPAGSRNGPSHGSWAPVTSANSEEQEAVKVFSEDLPHLPESRDSHTPEQQDSSVKTNTNGSSTNVDDDFDDFIPVGKNGKPLRIKPAPKAFIPDRYFRRGFPLSRFQAQSRAPFETPSANPTLAQLPASQPVPVAILDAPDSVRASDDPVSKEKDERSQQNSVLEGPVCWGKKKDDPKETVPVADCEERVVCAPLNSPPETKSQPSSNESKLKDDRGSNRSKPSKWNINAKEFVIPSNTSDARVPQSYQPVTEVNTRNGPLFVNPLAFPSPMYISDGYAENPFSAYYGQNGYCSNGVPANLDLPGAGNVFLSSQASLIKSFYFDSEQTGIIIGKNGVALNDDRWRCDCEIWIDEENAKLRGVSTLHFYGREQSVDAAVSRIRHRLESIGAELYPIAGLKTGNELHPPITKLDLPHGVVLQAFVSQVDESGLVFLQLPSHPSYLKIRSLEVRLSDYCGDNGVSPFIDVRHTPLREGCVVAASVTEDSDQWLRAIVISEPDEYGEIHLRSLDHGFPFQSYASNLKFLPAEFCVTPMQAIECRVVSGRFDSDKDVLEQIDYKISSSISKQWVKAKAVAEMPSVYPGTPGLPVVELLISTATSTIPGVGAS